MVPLTFDPPRKRKSFTLKHTAKPAQDFENPSDRVADPESNTSINLNPANYQSLAMTIDELLTQILEFRDARDWKQFHTLRNLIVSTSIEAGELLETIQWKNDSEIEALVSAPTEIEKLKHECADVFIYLLLVAHEAGFDLVNAAAEKVQLNARRYPVDKAKGTAAKYSDL